MGQVSGFVQSIYEKFLDLKKVPLSDPFEVSNMSLDELVKKGYMNLTSTKKPLVHLSILIENYAKKNNAPLLASFEREEKFKFAQDRYVELMNSLPKVWVIGDFNNAFLVQNFPDNAQTISCNGTNLVHVWAVLTKGPAGPMGMVVETIDDENYHGFFSVAPKIVQESINAINATLKCQIDLKSYS